VRGWCGGVVRWNRVAGAVGASNGMGGGRILIVTGRTTRQAGRRDDEPVSTSGRAKATSPPFRANRSTTEKGPPRIYDERAAVNNDARKQLTHIRERATPVLCRMVASILGGGCMRQHPHGYITSSTHHPDRLAPILRSFAGHNWDDMPGSRNNSGDTKLPSGHCRTHNCG